MARGATMVAPRRQFELTVRYPSRHPGPDPGGRSPAKSDAFPTTLQTHIGHLLDDADRGHIHAGQYLMEVYADPLRIYLRGSSFRDVGETDEVIGAFFADRLARPGFLRDWESSRARLRYWLIRAFRNFLLEFIRARRRHEGRREALPPELSESDSVEGPEATFHREVALGLIQAAMRIAEAECREAGLTEHWSVFLRHHVNGDAYDMIGADLGVRPARAAVMARTAAGKFKGQLREQITWRGASDDDLDQELQSLMDVVRS